MILAVTDSLAGGLRATELGATHLLLRNPALSTNQQYHVLLRLVEATSLPVLARGRPDLALTTGAAGVNLPEGDIGAVAARELLGPGPLVGQSAHSVSDALAAASGPVDFVILGPVFPTPSHPGQAGLGLDAIAEAARQARAPILAIGGLDRERGEACLAVGAGGFAAVRMFH